MRDTLHGQFEQPPYPPERMRRVETGTPSANQLQRARLKHQGECSVWQSA